jgi:hypothetical protein
MTNGRVLALCLLSGVLGASVHASVASQPTPPSCPEPSARPLAPALSGNVEEQYQKAKVRVVAASVDKDRAIATATIAIGRDADVCGQMNVKGARINQCEWRFGAQWIRVTDFGGVFFSDEVGKTPH